MDNEQALDHSRKLGTLTNQLDIIIRLLGELAYSKTKGDSYSLHYHLGNGLLTSLCDNLTTIKEDIQNVADDVCPDDFINE